MGARFYRERECKSGVSFFRMWPSEGAGRWTKRKLSKARRKAWKNPGHERGLLSWESECNWKCW